MYNVYAKQEFSVYHDNTWQIYTSEGIFMCALIFQMKCTGIRKPREAEIVYE